MGVWGGGGGGGAGGWSTGTKKYRFTRLQGRKNTVLHYHRDGEKQGRRPCIKNPIYLKMPYIKNLAV